MTELPTPDRITFEWIERESQLFSCRATIDREQLQAWIDRSQMTGTTPEELDAEDIGEFLDNHPEIDQRRWPGDEIVVESFDAKVVQP